MILIFLMFMLFCIPVQAGELKDYEQFFQSSRGWIGADGVYSVPMNEKKIFWIFGDTFIGKIRKNHRINAKMIHNSIAIQEHDGKRLLKPQFSWGSKGMREPSDFVMSPDRRGWLWPLHGTCGKNGLFQFFIQIEGTGDNSPFAFRTVGLWLARIPDPHSPPETWRVIFRKVPWAFFNKDTSLFWGSAVFQEGDKLFIYGIRETTGSPGSPKELVIARVSPNSIDKFNEWEFYSSTGWIKDFRKAVSLADGMATEFSVSRHSGPLPYVLVVSQSFPATRNILIRRAQSPEGPWSSPQAVYSIPGYEGNPNIFWYAAKEHPEIAQAADQLVISFTNNSMDFFDLAKDAGLYFPRFIRYP